VLSLSLGPTAASAPSMAWIRVCRRSISSQHGPAKLFDVNAATAAALSTIKR
jgi:hypothetical protein